MLLQICSSYRGTMSRRSCGSEVTEISEQKMFEGDDGEEQRRSQLHCVVEDQRKQMIGC